MLDNTATLADPIGFLPLETQKLVAVDFEQVRRSTLWATLEPYVVRLGGSRLEAVKRICGVDPLLVPRRVIVGEGPGGDGVLVVSVSDLPRLVECARRAGTRTTEFSVDDGVLTLFAQQDQPPIVASLVGDETIVAVYGPSASAARLRAVVDGGAPLRGSPEFIAMLDRTDSSASAWFVLDGKHEALDQLNLQASRPTWVFGSLALQADLSARVHYRLGSPAMAAKLAATVQPLVSNAAAVFSRLEVRAVADEVVMTAEMTEAQVATTVTMLVNRFGGPAGP